MDAPGWQAPATAPHPAPDSAQASTTTATTGAAQAITLSAAVEKYIAAKDPELAEGSKRNVYVNVRQFAEAITETRGRDITLTELDRDMIRDYGRLMAAQPANPKSREYAGKRLHALAALDLPAEKRLSAKTLNTKFNMVRSLLNWLELEYGIIAKPLNAAFVIPKAQGKARSSRRPFTTEELQRLFNPRPYLAATEQSPAYFWTPLIALFTGMRIEEIAQLLVTDIRQDDGVWCIDVNEAGDGKHVKTEAGVRLVPLPPVPDRRPWVPAVRRGTEGRRTPSPVPRPQARETRQRRWPHHHMVHPVPAQAGHRRDGRRGGKLRRVSLFPLHCDQPP